MARIDAEAIAEWAYRLAEFRKWLESNVLFPTAPDSLVNPARESVLALENCLVVNLYNRGEFERIAAIHRGLLTKPNVKAQSMP